MEDTSLEELWRSRRTRRPIVVSALVGAVLAPSIVLLVESRTAGGGLPPFVWLFAPVIGALLGARIWLGIAEIRSSGVGAGPHEWDAEEARFRALRDRAQNDDRVAEEYARELERMLADVEAMQPELKPGAAAAVKTERLRLQEELTLLRRRLGTGAA